MLQSLAVGVRLRRFAHLLAVVLIALASISPAWSTNATSEQILAPKPQPVSHTDYRVGDLYGGALTFSNGSQCGGTSGVSNWPYASDTEFLSCVDQIAAANTNLCSHLQPVWTEAWIVASDSHWYGGYPERKHRGWSVSALGHHVVNNVDLCDIPVTLHGTATADMDFSCATGFQVFDGDPACTSTVTKTVKGPTPMACPANGNPDTRRANPCDAATGDKSLAEQDYVSPALTFTRYYHSIVQVSSAAMGIGWTHTYSSRVVKNSGGLPEVYVDSSGNSEPLRETSSGSGIYLSITGSGTQVRTGNFGSNGIGASTEWVAFRPSGNYEFYQKSTGRLLRIQEPSGQVTTLTYTGYTGELNVLTSVRGPFGHTLTFHYDALGIRVTSITDPMGRDILYDYQDDNLSKVTYQDGAYRQYLYGVASYPGQFPHHLVGIVDEVGTQFATYDYDDHGRVISSEHAGGVGKITLVYDDTANTTTVKTYKTGSTTVDEVFTFTAYTNPWTWTYAGNSYNSLDAAIAAARATSNCPACQYLEVSSFGNYNPESGSGYPYRKANSTTLDGSGMAYTYMPTTSTDFARRPDVVTDESGSETKYVYADVFHRLSVTEANQDNAFKRTTTYAYLEDTSDLPSQVLTPSVKGGGDTRSVTTDYYSGTRLPQMVTVSGYDPAQPSTLLERSWTYSNYNSFGQAQTINGPRTDVTDTSAIVYWDQSSPGVACSSGGGAWTGGGACGQVKSITNALSQPTTYDYYDAAGRLTQMTNPEGTITSYTYDYRGRLDTVTEDPLVGVSRVTDYDYYDTGLLKKVTFPNGQVLNYTWTSAHLLDYVTDNAGNKIDYGYDLRGNRTSENLKTSGGSITKALAMTYDYRNRLATRQEGSHPAAQIHFNAVGELDDETDPRSAFTDYQYDPLKRLKKTIDPQNGAGAPTQYGYDVQDNIQTVTTPNGAQTTYVYDDLGNVRKEVSPDRGVTLYGYDAAGNMTCKADGRLSAWAATCEAASTHWTYQYDALNRVTSIDYPGTSANPDVEFHYDTRTGGAAQPGRLRTIIAVSDDGNNTVTRDLDYDAFGNVIWSQQTINDGSAAKTTEFEYDGNNQLTKVTYPSGRFVEYARAANGRVSSVTATFNGQTTTLVSAINYLPFGPSLATTYGNGLVSARWYDTAYGISENDLLISGTWSALDERFYTLDNNGNIDYVDDSVHGPRDYSYDALNRLTFDSDTSSTSPTYTYDGNGNRLTRAGAEPYTISYAANTNRISTLGGTSVLYDGMGNVKDLPDGQSSVAGLSYNAGGRLSKVVDNLVPTTLDEVLYNGMGELARTKLYAPDPCLQDPVLLAKEYFTFSPEGKALALTSVNQGHTETDYVWLDDMPIAQFVDSFDAGNSYQGTELTYLHADHLGTPIVGTDQAQNVVFRSETDAFGHGYFSGVSVRLRMPGQIDLGAAGISYNYFRDYDSNTGRYLESDPIGLYGGSLSTFPYANGRPLSIKDPKGLSLEFIIVPVVIGYACFELYCIKTGIDKCANRFPHHGDVLSRDYAQFAQCQKAVVTICATMGAFGQDPVGSAAGELGGRIGEGIGGEW